MSSIRSVLSRFRWLPMLAAAGLLIVQGPPAEAAASGAGNDISWPQCGKTLPTGQAFGIVGVNNGLANTTNPCLATELSWAGNSKGTTLQSKTALYVNTANPGTAGSWWPSSNTYAGTMVSNPYGECTATTNQVGTACSFMYGWAKAYDDANIRGISTPSAYTWWLDVETGNTWSSDTSANRADLEGMAAYFGSINATTGLYSTATQWSQLIGSVPATSPLYRLNSWLAGSRTATAAKRNCSASPLTGGGRVTLTQYVSGGLDYDNSCI